MYALIAAIWGVSVGINIAGNNIGFACMFGFLVLLNCFQAANSSEPDEDEEDEDDGD